MQNTENLIQPISKLTGLDRYSYDLASNGHWQVWDHEDAELVADRDGNVDFTERDARDLYMEYCFS